MRHMTYHQPVPHKMTIHPSGRTYVFEVRHSISLAKIEDVDVRTLLRITRGRSNCSACSKAKIYYIASTAQVRRWNGSPRPEHFDYRYEPEQEETAILMELDISTLKWPRLSIIVPVWNKAELTWRFIQGFAQYGNFANAELVVVDNGSVDNTPAILEKWMKVYPGKITPVRLEQNEGVSAGYNTGAEHAKSSYLLFMNNDVQVHGDITTLLIQALMDQSDKKLYGAHLVAHDGRWNRFGDVLIQYLEGWYLGCSKEVFKELGGFDVRYSPCDYEDVDFSYAAIQKGYKLQRLDVPASHMSVGSSASQLDDRLGITKRNRKRFRTKWSLS